MLRYHRSANPVGHENYFKGQIIVLVNELTESYSEYVTMLLQANPKTITIGSASSGADGNISTLEFPGGIKTIYSGIGIYYPDMKPTQRTGVRIDYRVEPTVRSIQEGVDLILEKAVAVAGQESLFNQ
jgi:C-terminal processing protease CtpA/Prc